MDFRLEFLRPREKRVLQLVLLAAAVLLLAGALYVRPPAQARPTPAAGGAAHVTVDVGGGRQVVLVRRVRAPGFVGPILVDQDHWITVPPG